MTGLVGRGLSCPPENLTAKALLRQRVQPVQKISVVDHPAAQTLQMHAVEQLVDRGQNLVDATLLDQLCRDSVL